MSTIPEHCTSSPRRSLRKRVYLAAVALIVLLGSAIGFTTSAAQARTTTLPSGTEVLRCDNYVEQNNYARPLGTGPGGYSSTKQTIQGVAISCHSTFAILKNIRSASYVDSGGSSPDLNNVNLRTPTAACYDTVQPKTQVTFTWSNGLRSVIQFEQTPDGQFPSSVVDGLFQGNDVVVDATDIVTYFHQLGNCSATNPAGPSDGYYINPWIPNHGSFLKIVTP